MHSTDPMRPGVWVCAPTARRGKYWQHVTDEDTVEAEPPRWTRPILLDLDADRPSVAWVRGASGSPEVALCVNGFISNQTLTFGAARWGLVATGTTTDTWLADLAVALLDDVDAQLAGLPGRLARLVSESITDDSPNAYRARPGLAQRLRDELAEPCGDRRTVPPRTTLSDVLVEVNDHHHRWAQARALCSAGQDYRVIAATYCPDVAVLHRWEPAWVLTESGRITDNPFGLPENSPRDAPADGLGLRARALNAVERAAKGPLGAVLSCIPLTRHADRKEDR